MALATAESSAVPIEVAARATIDADIRTFGRVVRVWGQLRDDLGRPIPRQFVQVGADSPASATRRMETDVRGNFAANLIVDEGDRTIRLTWSGDPVRDPVSAQFTVGVRLAQGILSIEAPQTVTPDAAWTISIRVTADGQSVPGALVTLDGDCVPATLAKADANGEIAYSVPPLRGIDEGSSDGGSGRPANRCSLQASLGPGMVHTAASATSVTRVVESPTLEMAVGEAEYGLLRAPRWPVSGTLADVHGAISGVSVQILLDGTPVGGVRTDDAGRFELRWMATDVAPGVHSLRARFEPDEGSGAVESRPVAVAIRRDPSAIVAMVALPVAVLCVFVVVAAFASGRSRPRGPGTAKRQVAAAATVPGTPGIHVVDATGRQPIAARLTLQWSDGAAESLELEAGEAVRPRLDVRLVRIVAEADGFVAAELDFGLVVDRRIEVSLVPFRTAVRTVLEDVAAERTGLRRGWWGRRLASEVAEEVARRVAVLRRDEGEPHTFNARLETLVERARKQDHGAPAVAVEALAMLVERANFGRRSAGAPDLELARELSRIAMQTRSS